MKDHGSAEAHTVLLWSGGKDALLALLALEQGGASVGAHPKSTSSLGAGHSGAVGAHPKSTSSLGAGHSGAVGALVTTVAGPEERVTMHGVGRPLVEAQARALGLPLVVMRQPARAPNEEYERLLGETLAPLREDDVRCVAAGDLFLEDVRAYREALLQRLGFAPCFPLWGRDTEALARRFVTEGYRAVVCSVDTTQLEAAFAGRAYDADFLSDLPAQVDPCGERGAFHTFVTDGPRFREAVHVKVGGVHREGRLARASLQPER